jgi:hypothetical protein
MRAAEDSSAVTAAVSVVVEISVAEVISVAGETSESGATVLMKELDEVGIATFTARDYKPGELVHVVLFRFAADAPQGTRRDVADRFLSLASSPRHDGKPYILSIEAGAQHSGEPAAEHGFEVAFVVRFASEGDRNYYVGAPIVTDPGHLDAAHDRFKQFVGPLLDPQAGVLVFDFTPGGF